MESRPPWGMPAPQSGLIHLAYRHGDVDDTAGRIYDRLVARYGRERIARDLFGQLDELPPEPAAQAFLDGQMDRVIAQVIIMGPRWLEGITRPHDIERVEVGAALRRQLPLIPVLAEGATMPAGAQLPQEIASLTYFNAAQARLDPDFDADMQRLLETVGQYTPGLAMQAPAASVASAPGIRAQRRGCSPLRVLAIGTVVPALLFLVLAIALTLIGPGVSSLAAQNATPAATATMLPTPPPAGSYYSPLTDGMKDWLLGENCKPEADGLHIANSNSGCAAPFEAGAADADFSVKARQTSGDINTPYGLYFRGAAFGGDEYYAMFIASSGEWSAVKALYNQPAVFMATWRPSAAIHAGLGATNTIEVKFRGPELIFFINGQRVGALSDSSINPLGSPDDIGDNETDGVFGHSGIEVVFTNYSIKPA